jgi:hypothetical protein
LVGCSPGTAEDRICTLVGSYNGVQVSFGPGLLPRTKPVALKLCADDTCLDTTETGLGPEPSFVVRTANGSASRIKVSATAAVAGRQVFADAIVVTPIKREPNGPNCGTWWNATVTAKSTNVLVQS